MADDEDIERLKARLEELERENTRLRAVIKASPAAFIVVNEKGNIVEHNDAALDVRGSDDTKHLLEIPLELWADRWQTFRPDGNLYEPTELPLARALLHGEVTDGEDLIIRDEAGTERWVSAHAAPVVTQDGSRMGAVVLFPDITERKQAELAAQRFRGMAEASPDYVGMADLDGNALYVNPAGRALCGLSDDVDVATLHISNFHPPADTKRVLEKGLPIALEHGVWGAKNTLLHVNGETIPVSQALMAHKDASGKVAFLSTVMRDLRPMQDLQLQLAQSQRLDALGRLAGGIAHDFNNLLTVITNYVHLVQESQSLDSNGVDDLAQVLVASGKAARLCEQMLSFARRQLVQPTRLDLGEVIEEDGSMFSRTLGVDVVLDTHVAPGLWPVSLDRSQLDQVLLNLVVNARDAMDGKGALTLSASNFVVADDPVATISSEVDPGDYVLLEVVDTGCGIPPDVQDRVFDPFFSTKGADQGTGLGLATVHGAVRQAGGHIWFETAEGKGTTFRLIWPRAE